MADFVVPRHSAVMERLRRRIELFRRHHNSCETRYDGTTIERMELERQQTVALHQRCLQTKAKRSNKHRQQGPAAAPSEQGGQRAPGAGGANSELPESGGAPGEQSRNSTLIALQETVKRKLENAGSPLGRDQVNGYPPSKKSCLEDTLGGLNGTSNGAVPPLSPLDTKHGLSTDSMVLNGTHATGGTEQNGVGLTDGCNVRGAESDIRLKEMKQEPMDDILPSGASSGNIILPDLNLNEQEWTELMEEFNRSVPYEEIQELFNDGFEDRKDSDLTSGGAPPNLLPSDLTIKAEFSPAPASSSAFEQDSRTGSPHVPPSSSGPLLHTGSPVTAPSAASSPALPGPQHPQQQQPQPGQPSRTHQNHLLTGPPKDLSPAQHLQQLAAREQQRAQLMQSQQHQSQKQQQQKQQQQQQQQQQAAPKFHQQSNHPSTWPQNNPTQSPLGGTFGMEKPTSPSMYTTDFQNPKPLLMPGQQPSKASPKPGAQGGYMQPGAHTMLSHPAAPSGTLNHPTSAILDYNNTKPLSHYEAGAPGPPRGPAPPQPQNKATLLNILRHQQMKLRPHSMPFRPQSHLPLTQQEPGTYPSGPHVPGPGGTMATQPGGGGMAPSHANVSYLSGLQKQQQQQMQMLSSQQNQFLIGQQQRHMMAEKEKQRQQKEQMQRHLTRPPPQYQDQPNPSAQQNPFQQQQQVSQFQGSSQTMASVNPLGGPNPSGQRMFPQTQGMMGMGQGGGPAPNAPPTASQTDMSLSSCAGGLDVQQVLYGMHPSHPNQQRLPVSSIPAAYRQNVLAQQQAHLKSQPNAALLKQQQLARLPNSMPNTLANSMNSAMPNSMAGNMSGAMPPQAQAWQQQPHPGLQQGMAGQPNPSNSNMPPAFPSSGFHMQPRLPKLPGNAPFSQAGMGNGAANRAMTSMNPGQMMSNMSQQRTNNTGLGQQLPPPNQQQQAQQGQQAPPQAQQVLPDLGAFGQPQGAQVPNRTTGMQCNQAYQVSRSAGQQLPFGYNTQPGASLPSFPAESDLVDSLLKNQPTHEWMDDLDELLASHQ